MNSEDRILIAQWIAILIMLAGICIKVVGNSNFGWGVLIAVGAVVLSVATKLKYREKHMRESK